MNIEQVRKQALDYLLRHGNHPQAVHIFGTKGSTIALLADIPEDGSGKGKALFAAGRKAARAGNIGTLQQMFLVSEAWVSVHMTGNTPIPPSTDPGRKEALVVYGIDVLTKEQRMFLFELVRSKEGIVRTIQPLGGREEMQAVSNPFLMTFLAGYASWTPVKNDTPPPKE